VNTAYIIPLQFKQAGVKNGLIKLRKQLRSYGILMDVVSLTSIVALTARFFISGTVYRYIIVTVVFLNALSALWKSLIFKAIYHQNYSPESIKLHAKIAKLEKK
jgi:hypothetical protein